MLLRTASSRRSTGYRSRCSQIPTIRLRRSTASGASGAATDVHAVVLAHARGVRMEEEEVARLQLVSRHVGARVVLKAGVVTEPDPKLTVDVHRETGAVEPKRRCASPDVRDAEEAIRERDRLAAQRVRRRREQDARLEEDWDACQRSLRRGELWQAEHG